MLGNRLCSVNIRAGGKWGEGGITMKKKNSGKILLCQKTQPENILAENQKYSAFDFLQRIFIFQRKTDIFHNIFHLVKNPIFHQIFFHCKLFHQPMS